MARPTRAQALLGALRDNWKPAGAMKRRLIVHQSSALAAFRMKGNSSLAMKSEFRKFALTSRTATNALSIALTMASFQFPFVTHNDELLQMLAPQFEQELKEGRTKQSILGQVKWVLKRLLAGSRPGAEVLRS